jgi:hypothetical protein
MIQGRARRDRAVGLLAVGLSIASLLLAAPAAGESGNGESDEGVSREPTGVDTDDLEAPPFPGVEVARPLRVQAQSRFVPGADLDPGHVDLYSPSLSARLKLPINGRVVARVNLRLGMSHYRFSGGTPLARFDPSGVPTRPPLADPLDLYQTKLSLDGAYRLSDEGQHWLVEGESWSLIGNVFGQSSWEGGDFDEGMTGGVAVGFGYRIPDRLRVSLGAVVRTDLAEGGYDIGPFGSFRWQITDDLTLRDRGLGLLLDYRLSRRVELFATGFRTTTSSRLKDRFGLDDLTFRDRQIQAGGGCEWRITRWLRVSLEVGAVFERKLRVHSDALGTLYSERAGPTPYAQLGFEVRPGWLNGGP